MTSIITPPAFMDGTTTDASVARAALGSLIETSGGVVAPGDLQVTQNGTPNMSVNVGPGRIWVPGTSVAVETNGSGASWHPQGAYFSELDGTQNLSITAANATLPRIDRVAAVVQDAAYGAANKEIILEVLTGTATAGATLSNLSGAAALLASSLTVANVLVPANATTITTGDIANVIGTVGTLKARGTVTVNWPGGAPASGASTVAHGLGVAPSEILLGGTYSTDGYFVVYNVNSATINATTFAVNSYAVSGNPANGQTSQFWWLAYA